MYGAFFLVKYLLLNQQRAWMQRNCPECSSYGSYNINDRNLNVQFPLPSAWLGHFRNEKQFWIAWTLQEILKSCSLILRLEVNYYYCAFSLKIRLISTISCIGPDHNSLFLSHNHVWSRKINSAQKFMDKKSWLKSAISLNGQSGKEANIKANNCSENTFSSVGLGT